MSSTQSIASSIGELTPAAVQKVRELIQRDEEELNGLVPVEQQLEERFEEAKRELASCRAIMADLRDSITRRRGKIGDDVIARIHVEPPQPLPVRVDLGDDPSKVYPCVCCGEDVVAHLQLAIWTHEKNGAAADGYLCWPTRPDSTVATPPAAASLQDPPPSSEGDPEDPLGQTLVGLPDMDGPVTAGREPYPPAGGQQ